MARKFITTDIVDPVKAPLTEKALRHINEIPNELGDSLVKAMIGAYTTGDLVILDGCVVVANIPGTSTVTAGSIYYNGEIYQVDVNASISSPSDTLVWQAVNTLVDGAQTKFSDAVDYDFLSIRKLRLVNGASGSGLANYNGATVKKHTHVGATNAAPTAFSSSNASSISIQQNSIRKGNIVNTSIKFSCVVTVGGTLTNIVANTVSDIAMLPSSLTNPITGTFICFNNTINAIFQIANITNGLNSTDISIDANRRIVLALAAASVSNGDTVTVTIQFTGVCAV